MDDAQALRRVAAYLRYASERIPDVQRHFGTDRELREALAIVERRAAEERAAQAATNKE